MYRLWVLLPLIPIPRDSNRGVNHPKRRTKPSGSGDLSPSPSSAITVTLANSFCAYELLFSLSVNKVDGLKQYFSNYELYSLVNNKVHLMGHNRQFLERQDMGGRGRKCDTESYIGP